LNSNRLNETENRTKRKETEEKKELTWTQPTRA
jgi:hypothetical protein